MSITNFVSGSALLLAVWLGVTFVHRISPQDYPNQRRSAAHPAPAEQAQPGQAKVIVVEAR